MRLALFVLIGSIFLGYAWEFAPIGVEWKAPLEDDMNPVTAQWWVFILAKDVTIVFLAWTVWYLIPKDERLIKLAASVLCVFLTTFPVNFALFYFPPFKGWMFLARATTSIVIGIFLVYGINRNNNSVIS